MREKIIKVYKFDELSDQAKEHAIDKYNQGEYFWGDDAMASLKAFLNHFNCNLKDWSIDFLEPYRNNIKIAYPDPEEDEALYEDEILDLLNQLGSYDPETLRGNGDCKLTGYCMDESLIDGFRKAWFGGERDLKELIEAGISQWEIDVRVDAEYQYSEEGFKDLCEANDYEFTEDGEMI